MKNISSSQKNLYKVKVVKGKIYYWCVCSLSKKQPFCDISHKKYSALKPLKYLADETKEMYFCGCKKTTHQPFCDGSHFRL